MYLRRLLVCLKSPLAPVRKFVYESGVRGGFRWSEPL